MFDDVLKGHVFAAVARHLEAESYRPVERDRFNAWSGGREDPLRGVPIVLASAIDTELHTSLHRLGRAGALRIWPTASPFDVALGRVRVLAGNAPGLLGEEGKDWMVLIATPYKYGVGQRLQWHCDSSLYSGAFILYGHSRWDAEWGGELLVADGQGVESMKGVDAKDVLRKIGTGIYIAPVPNRLVLMASGVPHSIAAVTPAAGTATRTSLGGFFVTPRGCQLFAQHVGHSFRRHRPKQRSLASRRVKAHQRQ